MRAYTTVSLLLAFICTLASALEPERTVDIFAWPLSAPKSSSLARITYNSTAATVKSYTPPTIPPADALVRIGFYHPSGAWSGIATSTSNFAAEKDKKIQLHVNGEGQLYHLGFRASDLPSSSKTAANKKDGLSVEVVKVKKGPTVQLGKPIVVSEDGTSVPEREPEKTFLQKYWWAIAGFVVLQVILSGGKGE